MNKKKILNLIKRHIPSILLGITHIAIIVAIALSFRYYAIYPSIFGSIVGIVLCVLIIVDIIYFVGYNHKDRLLKIITCVMASLLLIGGAFGTYLLGSINSTVNNVIGDNDTYETVTGEFAYLPDGKHEYKNLVDLTGKRVGFVSETNRGVTTIAHELLDSNSIDVASFEYQTMTDLMFALVDGKVDVAVFAKGYRTLLSKDENNNFSNYVDKMVDFYEFTQDVKVTTKTSTKNLTNEPFNVLLIGWSRVEEGSTIGLADAIIVVTVNPKTYTASMMSIARDSYVDIPCYNNEKDKINSGRSTSRACFIETVEQLLGEKMDFYIEADYLAIVYLVNAVGGVEITNPVEFTLDGYVVPEGTYVAEGWVALQFCRERHAFAGGDFARQQHQKEVIMGVMQKLIESKDIQMALNAMNMAGNYLSTDLSLNQLTSVFNMILNTRNYTGLPVFDLLDFQTMRMSGYASYHYSYDYELPLWIYKLYDSSIMECVQRIEDIKDFSDVSGQKYGFTFSSSEPYVRPAFYTESFNESEVHEEMPPYYVDLTSMTYEEAIEWADENKVNLDFVYIEPYDPEYVAELDGMVVGQSVRYGKLISGNPDCTITIMGSHGVPNFVGKDIDKAKEWCKEHDVDYEKIAGEPYESEEDYKIIYKQKYDENEGIVYLYYYGEPAKVELAIESGQEKYGSVEGAGTYSIDGKATIKAIPADGYSFKGWYDSDNKLVSEEEEYKFTVEKKTKLTAKFYKDISSFVSVNYVTGSTDSMGSVSKALNADNSVTISAEAKQGYVFKGWYSDNTGSNKLTDDKSYKISSLSEKKTYYAKFAECEHSWDSYVIVDGCTAKEFTCSKCHGTKKDTLEKPEHDYQQISEDELSITYQCSRCGDEKINSKEFQ